MEKRIKNQRGIVYYICIIIIIIGLFAYFKHINTFTTIEGVKNAPNQPEIINLGKFNPKTNYTGYDAYILNDGSEFNLIKVFGAQLKYPNYFYPSGIEKDNLFLGTDKFNSLPNIRIKIIENIKNKSPKDYMEQIENGSKDLYGDNFNKNQEYKYSYTNNKVIVRYNSKSNPGNGTYREYLFVNNKIIMFNISYTELVSNIDNIINTMSNSFA